MLHLRSTSPTPDFIRSAVRGFWAIDQMSTVTRRASTLATAAEIVPALLGVGGSDRYLLLTLDNAELRPIGGLIGAFATPRFDDGMLSSLSFHDIADIDRIDQATYVEPPAALKGHLIGDFPWQVADAGWWPDITQNVAEVRRLYEVETGDSNFQGVVAFTPEVVDRLLAVIGPVEVPVAGVTVHAGETRLVSLMQVEVVRKGTNRKAFLADLASAVMARLLALPPNEFGEVWAALDDAGKRRELQVVLDDPVEQASIRRLGWSAPFTFPEHSDRLAIMEANLAPVSKIDELLTLKHRLEVTVHQDGSATEDLQTTYLNGFGPNLGSRLEPLREAFGSGLIASFQRRYLAPDAIVDAVSSDGTEPEIDSAELIDQESGCTVVGNYLLVGPGQATLETEYRVPDVASASRDDAAPRTYMLSFIKQPGRDNDSLSVDVHLPSGTHAVQWSSGGVANGQTVVFSTTTEFDRTMFVVFAQD
jgi:hypothetical protein